MKDPKNYDNKHFNFNIFLISSLLQSVFCYLLWLVQLVHLKFSFVTKNCLIKLLTFGKSNVDH